MSFDYQVMLDAGIHPFDIHIHHFICSFNVRLRKSNNAVIDVGVNCIQFYTTFIYVLLLA